MSARVATTANITLDNTTTVVDGVTLANGDLVLVKNQTTGTQNGLYVASTSGAWARSSLLPTGANAYLLIYYVTSGTVNAKTNFKCVITPAVVGTDSLVFMPFDTVFLNNLSATTAPTATDDNTKGYSVGSIWINTSTNMPYTCTNSGTGVAVWSQGGTGDVVGPSSATDNAITRFDGTTGKLVQNSTVTISDVAVVAGVKTLTMTDSTTNTISITPAASTTTYALTLPAAQGAANTFLQNNGSGVLSWTAAAGGGDVVGPASATNNAIARFDTTTGKLIKNSTVTISDTADIAAAKTLAMDGSASGTLTIMPAATTTSYTMTMPGAQGTANTYLSNDGSGGLSWAQGVAIAGLRGLRNISASGTYTPTAGTTRALVYATGGGGAGGGAASGVNNSVGSGGNAGGTYVGLFAIDDTKTGTVTVGTEGVGVSGGSGGDGTATTFLFPSTGTPNASITGNGGRGGGFKPTSTTDDYVITPNTNLSGGTATAVNAVLLGGYVILGMSGTQGFMISSDVGTSGNGGSSIYGGGAVGNTKNQASSASAGRSASGFGAGGSGGIQTSSAASSGGNGDGGVVVIYEY